MVTANPVFVQPRKEGEERDTTKTDDEATVTQSEDKSTLTPTFATTCRETHCNGSNFFCIYAIVDSHGRQIEHFGRSIPYVKVRR